jgi:mannose-6-phosphate isomerase-like protein (cupin superfamily)
MRTALMLIALLGLALPAAAQPGATYFPSQDVDAAFAKGMPLIEVPAYKIHASRRVQPGMAEIHELDTDLIRVLEGEATFVVGGKSVEAKPTAPGELRGKEIVGGHEYHLVPGDVIIVPAGVPHWFKAVEGTLLYYTIKVTSCQGATP